MNASLPVSEPVPRRGRQVLTPEEIAKHVAAFRQSGLFVAAYARQEGLSYYVLRGWLQHGSLHTVAKLSRQIHASAFIKVADQVHDLYTCAEMIPKEVIAELLRPIQVIIQVARHDE